MQFTIRDSRGRTEVRQHIPFTITQTGRHEWTAHDPRNGRLLARGNVSAEYLQETCATLTEHVRYANEPKA